MMMLQIKEISQYTIHRLIRTMGTSTWGQHKLQSLRCCNEIFGKHSWKKQESHVSRSIVPLNDVNENM